MHMQTNSIVIFYRLLGYLSDFLYTTGPHRYDVNGGVAYKYVDITGNQKKITYT